LGKVVILTGLDGNLGLYEMSYFLPNYQLSIFCQILQILFEYMHPILSLNQMSNWIEKKWRFETENGWILVAEIALLGWDTIWIHWPCRIRKPVSNWNPEKCGIENEKGQIQASGFTPFNWDI